MQFGSETVFLRQSTNFYLMGRDSWWVKGLDTRYRILDTGCWTLDTSRMSGIPLVREVAELLGC